LHVPPDDPLYTLRRIWLAKAEEEGYYHGMANSGLWPLCHVTFTRPAFETRHWEAYRAVNRRFAEAVLEEAGDRGDRPALVFIQDFHFGLLARMLKERNPNLIVAQFWHIPWPNREIFRTIPWQGELLDGLLGNDLLGFHLRYHCQNFLDTVDRGLEARVDMEHCSVTRGGRTTLVRPFPISIDVEAHEILADGAEVRAATERWKHTLAWRAGLRLAVGIERLDYTKGIPERFQAFDRLLEAHPEYRECVSFVQVAVPSRGHVAAYQRLDEEVDRLVELINWRWGTDTWAPIIYLKEHFGPVDMIALHRLAAFGVVSSLHDGMNLVAKEFVASRIDDDGALILSHFTGAARELPDALLVNPFAVGEITEAMRAALEMPVEEQQRRMRRMRAAVASNNVYRWAGKILSTLLRIELPEGA
jgi:trehalose 6-phosphate synthase